MKKRVFVFAIDGLSWNLLTPFLNQGKLPHFRSILKKSVKGEIVTSIPPMTIPAWVNFATGVNPAKHGFYFFAELNDEWQKVAMDFNQRPLAKTFYEILDSHGLKTVIVNLPLAFPLKTKNNLWLSSFLRTDEDLNYYPPGLRREIREIGKYRTFPSTHHLEKRVTFFRQAEKIERTRFKIAQKLVAKDWDFFFYLFSATDWVLHRLPAKEIKRLGSPKGRFYRFLKMADDQLGWLVKNLKKTDFLIMADHGFQVYSRNFVINQWLQEQGLLKVKHQWSLRLSKELKEQFRQILIRNPHHWRVRSLISFLRLFPLSLGVAGLLVRRFPQFFPRLAKGGFGHLGLRVDKAKSQCYSLDGWGIYVRLGPSGIKRVIRKLRDLKFPGTNRLVFAEVLTREEVYQGPGLKKLPQIICKWADIQVDFSLTAKRIFREENVCDHSRKGTIFLAFGPSIKRCRDKLKIKLEDVGPTVMAILGMGKPSRIEGIIVKEILK